MPNHGKYPDELRERAVRMVLDHGHEYGSQWEAICSVADKLGPRPETVRLWVRQAERDTGRRPGATTDSRTALHRLPGAATAGAYHPRRRRPSSQPPQRGGSEGPHVPLERAAVETVSTP